MNGEEALPLYAASWAAWYARMKMRKTTCVFYRGACIYGGIAYTVPRSQAQTSSGCVVNDESTKTSSVLNVSSDDGAQSV